MGMAASQARLLAITARLHDVEFAAQNIQQAKIQLSTQQDEVYEKYQNALDAVTLTFTRYENGGYATVPATFNNLFSANSVNNTNGVNYALIDSRGRLVVSDDVYEAYHDFQSSGLQQNPYAFALYMLYGDGEGHLHSDDWNNFLDVADDMIRTKMDEDEHLAELYYNVVGDPAGPEEEYSTRANVPLAVAIDSPLEHVLYSNNTEAAQEFLNYFFSHYGQQTFNNEQIPEEDLPNFNYYANIYAGIQQHGGCISINDFDGPDGDASNNSEWLTAMVQSGQFTLEQFRTDRNGNISMVGTSVSTDTRLNYSTTAQYDKVALARAEAEYEFALKQIDKKDKRFDLALNKLETERTALTKQYDSIKKVISDNVERTFGIFS